MATILEQKNALLEQKRGELQNLLNAHKNGAGEFTHNKDQILEIRSRNAELVTLSEEIKGLRELALIEADNKSALAEFEKPAGGLALPNGGRDAHHVTPKSFGKMFVDAKGHEKSTRNAEIVIPGVDVKTLFQTGDGFSPEIVRNRPVLLSAQRPTSVVDVMPVRETTQPGVKYMEETVYNNAAAETAEGGDYPEAELQFDEKTSPVEKIAVFIPVTEEQLEDVAYIESYLNARLPFMIRQRLDYQLVRGNGNSPNLTGMRLTNGVLTQATGANPLFDAIHMGITQIQTTAFADPNLVVMHPNDWQRIRLTRTADGLYILGNPDQQVSQNLWGTPIVATVVAVEGEAVIADTQFLELSPYKGVEVMTSNSHTDYFTKGKLAVRARIRAAFTKYRPQAICLVTGLNG